MTNSAVTGRGRVQQQAALLRTERAERDTRIAAAAAMVAGAQETIRGNAERRALAVAAAQRAIANAERDERDANTAADRQILTGVGQLRADGLSVTAIGQLLQLPLPRVRQLLKHTRAGAAAERSAAEQDAVERRPG